VNMGRFEDAIVKFHDLVKYFFGDDLETIPSIGEGKKTTNIACICVWSIMKVSKDVWKRVDSTNISLGIIKFQSFL